MVLDSCICYCIVLFVEVIQRTMMRIERDHYIQILLQASGIAGNLLSY